jgi:hypothetical protein
MKGVLWRMVMKGIGPVGFVIYDDGIIRAGRWAPLIEVLQRAERLATSRGTWRCLALPRPRRVAISPCDSWSAGSSWGTVDWNPPSIRVLFEWIRRILAYRNKLLLAIVWWMLSEESAAGVVHNGGWYDVEEANRRPVVAWCVYREDRVPPS